MKLNLLILSLIVIIASAWTYFTDTHTINPQKAIAKVENFKFQTLSGNQGALHDMEGGVVFVHFWATWCAPCVTELPQLIELAKAHPNKLTILAVAVDNKADDIKRFLTKYSIPENFIVPLDPEKQISQDLFGTIKLPETYIVGPNMTLYEKIIGSEENWNNDHWSTLIKNL